MDLPVTAIVAVRNEEANIQRCLLALRRAQRVIVVDSHSTDDTVRLSRELGAQVVQFSYTGRYPKKRQWAIQNCRISTDWIMLIDADEVVPDELWDELEATVDEPNGNDAYLVKKEFHLLGRRFRFGGFSFDAVVLFRRGKARFEELIDDVTSGLDMEVHERLIVEGGIGKLKRSLIHEDLKDLQAYFDRHNRYATWEAQVRQSYLKTGLYGRVAITARFLGNVQERRRFLKKLLMRLPCEPTLWFIYHYLLRMGFLEGRRGLIASQARAYYIAQVRARVFELTVNSDTR